MDNTIEQVTSAPENRTDENYDNKVPVNIWEIDNHYLCPVIGFCLSAGEQKHLFRKCIEGTDGSKRRLNAIEMHEFFVIGISREKSIARKVQRFLNIKYAKEISLYKDMSYREWLSMADLLCNPDQYGAYIWISASCFKGNIEEKSQIYGKIHIYSHELINQLKRCRLDLAQLRSENDTIIEKLGYIKAQQKWAEKEILRLNRECADIEAENRKLVSDGEYVKEHLPEITTLKESKASLERLLTEQSDHNRVLRRENELLYSQLNQTESAIASIKGGIAELIESLRVQEEQCGNCERVSLCRKRVLIVGGLSRMVVVYREIVEKLDGLFDFHDGRCHNGNEILRRQIRQSDLVICPIDINSHAACLEVKRVCKRTGKNFFMLRKSSVSTVYTALVTAANSGNDNEISSG